MNVHSLLLLILDKEPLAILSPIILVAPFQQQIRIMTVIPVVTVRAVEYKGAWWYGDCHDSNLNDVYHHGEDSPSGDRVTWNHWKGQEYTVKRDEKKIKPVGF